ncbi:MAG: adenylate/guanylate cyclase domain-containing protein [Rhodospirillales bacterium]|nr:adenylate/guanylate cyclase domain-containing protein [Rhodospirillales bacterium]
MGKFLKKAFKSVFSLERMFGFALLSAFVVTYHFNPYPVQYLQLKTFDYYQQLKPRPIPPPDQQPVVIIDLDELSLAEIGQWPWPRKILAQLVQNATQMGVAQIAFDVVFAEPDRMNPSSIIAALDGIDDETRRRLEQLKGGDALFAEAIKKSRVVLGQAGYWEDIETKPSPPVSSSVAFLKQGEGVDPKRFLPEFRSLVRNVAEIEPVAAGRGIFSLVPEPDGIVRRVPTMFLHKDQFYPSLSVEMLRVAFNRPTTLVRANAAGITEMAITKDIKIPTDSNGRVYPYFSKSDKSKYIPAKDILNGTVDPKKLAGKLSIVGTSAVGLLDIRAVPTEPVIPGVEVHVQLIESALHKAYLSRPNYFRVAEMALLLGGGLLMIWLVPFIGAKWTAILFFTIAGGAAGTSWHFFTNERLLFDAGFAIISIMVLYMFLTYTSYAREEAQRRQVRSAFAHYLSPAMVEKLAEDPTQLKLGGEMRNMTVLFCDVRGFTTISELYDAQGLTKLINRLLTPLTGIILKRLGTVDKYIGDCIMAFWNAPLDDQDHGRNACRAALEMDVAMKAFDKLVEAEAKAENRKHVHLKIGTGVNSGDIVVGNMGSDQRFDYSVLGDNVNLASRLEGQCKTYGVDIVVGENTAVKAPDFGLLEADVIKVKGKTAAVRIYALLGDETVAVKPEFIDLKKQHDDMLAAYRAQKWDLARMKLQTARGKMNGHNLGDLYELYEERIADFEKNPPPPDWDGVFVATTK